MLIAHELKNGFPCPDFSAVKKAVFSGEGRGHRCRVEDARRVGNAGRVSGLEQGRLSHLLRVCKHTLNYFLFGCCSGLPVSLLHIKRLDAVQHLESGKTFS